MTDLFTALIEKDAYNSILYTVLGGLILLAVFHLGMFLQNKDKSYLLYSLYTIFSFIAYMPVAESGFVSSLSKTAGLDNDSKIFFTIVFNCIYFFFFADFLNIKSINLKWYRIIVFPVTVLLTAGTLIFIGHKIYGLDHIFKWYKNAFIYLITLQTAISFYILTKVKNNLKYYIIFGGIILFICSIVGERTVREIPALNLSRKMGDFIYFVGLLIENIAFSLALGHKQRINHEQKVTFHKDLILELQRNERLKDEMTRENEKRLTVENDKIKYLQEISDLKFSLLQSRMNPHFIFNALNSVKYYILENDSQNAVDYLTKFSKIIRISLAASSLREFTLTEELQTLKLYMDIENLRFENKIDFTIHSAPDIDPDRVRLPPMVLQPFIENSILHGIAAVHDKKISVKILSVPDKILILITDNGIGRDRAAQIKAIRSTHTKSLGIEIARDMLKNYFGAGNFSVVYTDLHENNIASGTTVEISIPKPEN
ncbi:sensor histidine kinase YesM [Chryseobacterium sp. HSC-36S06]|nr:sensor histidine kinase YesM [Chryseobacterium sp. HSC-36S06]